MPRTPQLLLLAIAALVFWPALLGSYVYDDTVLIVRDAALQNGDLWALVTELPFGDQYGYWRPLTATALWLGHSLGGAFGIHALALLLHGASAWIGFDVALRILGGRRSAFWAALLFVVHPVQVESVAWCSAINDPLWGLFALLAVRSTLRWRDRSRAGMPWTSAAFVLLALLTKENAAATVPIVLAAVLWSPAADGSVEPRRSVAASATPIGIALAIWWLLRAIVFGEPSAGFLRAPEVPALDVLRLLTAPIELLLRHLALLVWPFPLSPFRNFDPVVGTGSAAVLFVLGAITLALAGLAWRKVHVRMPIVLLLAPLLPTLLAYRSIGAYPIADRYLNLATLGAALLLARHTTAKPWILALLSMACAALSFTQTWVWHDPQSFVAHGQKCAPEDPTLMVMAGELALAEAQSGSIEALRQARQNYRRAEQRAAELSSDVPHRALAEARLGLAWCTMLEQGGQRIGDGGALVAAFRRAVDTDPSKPAAWVGLGVANGIAQRAQDAERAFRTALDLDPEYSEAWGNLGYLYLQTGNTTAARESLEAALRCDPGNVRARQLLAGLR